MKNRIALICLLLLATACTHAPESKKAEPKAVAAATCIAEAPEFAPPPTMQSDTALQAYLQNLSQAVKKQDTELLLSLIDPKIATGFDASGGVTEFRKRWHLPSAKSEVWPLLGKLLDLGGSYLSGGPSNTFALPYVYSAWPDSVDAFSHQAITTQGAALRPEPTTSAPVTCTLPRTIVQADLDKSFPQHSRPEQVQWWYVRVGQASGYVTAADLYSPVGYRAILTKSARGQWRMTALVAGD